MSSSVVPRRVLPWSRHHDMAKVSFTGGVETARKILATAAESITPVVLELGGKSGSIVFADADLAAAGQFSGAVPWAWPARRACRPRG